MKYVLMEFLLSGENERPPELHTAQYLPVPVDPAQALSEVAGDLLRGHYSTIKSFVCLVVKHKDL
jgi:hypothetical protein